MAEGSIAITPGSGALVRVENIPGATGVQEVVTLGSPSTVSYLAEVSSTGELQAATKPSTVGTASAVAATTADAVLCTANTSRLGGLISNQSGQTAYIRLGTTAASAGVNTVSLPNGGYYEMPANYRGAAHVILASGSGNVMFTELT